MKILVAAISSYLLVGMQIVASAAPGDELSATGSATTSAGAPGSVFRDCADCPEMVVLPAGSFTMGSSAEEKAWAASQVGSAEGVADEAPQHNVSLPSFAIAKYDVTRGEYAAFVRETGYPAGDGCGRDSFRWKKQAHKSWENPGFHQSGRDPVVCVSWQDAKAYIGWLNGRVRQKSSASSDGPYRLPSESEWEYAARAGTSTRFWWGDDDAATSDHAWYKPNSGGHTHPVGSKGVNAFGLYDVVGDVWQWTADCYAESYSSTPTDGRANETGVIDPRPNGTKECMRVDRGGSFFFPTVGVALGHARKEPRRLSRRVHGIPRGQDASLKCSRARGAGPTSPCGRCRLIALAAENQGPFAARALPAEGLRAVADATVVVVQGSRACHHLMRLVLPGSGPLRQSGNAPSCGDRTFAEHVLSDVADRAHQRHNLRRRGVRAF
jgi:formylglycine-generating enzyme required for sulfatase activity